MPTASIAKPKTSPLGSTTTGAKSLYTSTQSRFATNNLIKNLGSGNDGVKFSFTNQLRTAYGRD